MLLNLRKCSMYQTIRVWTLAAFNKQLQRINFRRAHTAR